MKKILTVIAVALVGLCFGRVVFAESIEDNEARMTISPPSQKIILIPGEVYEGAIEVSNSNNSKTDLKYSVTIGSLSYVKDENGDTDYNDTDVDTITGYNQIMEWITLGKDKGTVAPNSSDTVPFTITVPADAPGGGQYATIIVQNDTNQDSEYNSDGSDVSIQSIVRFAASIFAEVAGETREKGVILENNIPAFLFNNTLSAVSKVRNEGNVHTNAKYTLQVWPLFSDDEICTNEEEPSESMVMPDTERVHAEECRLPQVGIFRAKQTVEIFGEKSEMERMIFVCPLWLLFLIIFGIILLVMWYVAKARAKSK